MRHWSSDDDDDDDDDDAGPCCYPSATLNYSQFQTEAATTPKTFDDDVSRSICGAAL